jgi:hypothetical protein
VECEGELEVPRAAALGDEDGARNALARREALPPASEMAAIAPKRIQTSQSGKPPSNEAPV